MTTVRLRFEDYEAPGWGPDRAERWVDLLHNATGTLVCESGAQRLMTEPYVAVIELAVLLARWVRRGGDSAFDYAPDDFEFPVLLTIRCQADGWWIEFPRELQTGAGVRIGTREAMLELVNGFLGDVRAACIAPEVPLSPDAGSPRPPAGDSSSQNRRVKRAGRHNPRSTRPRSAPP